MRRRPCYITSYSIAMSILKKVIAVALFLLVMTGCTDAYRVSEDDFAHKHLTAEKIPVAEFIHPIDMKIKEGMLAISAYKSEYMLYLYSIPDFKLISSGGIQGQGPYEFHKPFMRIFNSTSDELFIWDLAVHIMRAFPDSTGGVYFKKANSIGRYMSFNDINLLCSDSVIVYNDINEVSVNKYDFLDDTILGRIKLKDAGHGSNYNPNTGVMMANDSVIVYAYTYRDRIDIYDSRTMELKKRISGPRKSHIDGRNSKRYNTGTYQGKKYFYLYFLKSGTEDDESSVRSYDYYGNPVTEYTFDILPYRIAVDEENGYIYGWNPHYEDFWLRYKL